MNDHQKINVAVLKNINVLEIFKWMPGHIYWKDKEGYYLGCNQEQADQIGLAQCEDIIGKTDYDLLPEDQANELRLNDMKVMRTGVPATIEEQDYLSKKIPLYNEAGHIIGLLGISINIKSYKDTIKQNKKMLDEIVAAMPGHVYWKDRQGILLGCNEQQAHDAGMTSRHEIVGKNAYDLINKALPEEVKQAHAAAINIADQEIMASGIARTFEEPAVELDGSETIYLSQKTPLFDNAGQVVGLLGISVDITERKQLESKLRQAKHQAESANRLKSEFIRNMQHDIRTPVSGLKLMLSLLDQEADLNQSRHLIRHAYNSATELLDICNEVTDFDNIKYSDTSIYTKKFSVLKLAHAVIQLNAAIAMVKTLNLILNVADDVPDIIKGDEHRLKKILINLLGNALKFTDSGEVSLTISVVSRNATTVVLAFDVADTGIGIADEDIDRIYEQFTRLNPAIEGHFKGTGLGLHVVKQYVDELGGDIDVTSEVGVGSHFVVTLPFKLPLAATLLQQHASTVTALPRQWRIA